MFGSSSFYSKNSFLSIQYEVFYKKVKKKVLAYLWEFLICGSKAWMCYGCPVEAIRHGKNMPVFDYFISDECSY